MTIAIAFPGFNDLGRSMTPMFLLMDHFMYQFPTFSKKVKKVFRLHFVEGLRSVKTLPHLELFTQQAYLYKMWLVGWIVGLL